MAGNQAAVALTHPGRLKAKLAKGRTLICDRLRGRMGKRCQANTYREDPNVQPAKPLRLMVDLAHQFQYTAEKEGVFE